MVSHRYDTSLENQSDDLCENVKYYFLENDESLTTLRTIMSEIYTEIPCKPVNKRRSLANIISHLSLLHRDLN